LIEEAAVTVSRSRRRSARPAVLALVVGLIAGAATAACSAGQITQTAAQVAAVPGANANASPNNAIALRNLFVVYNGPDGYAQGASAPLVVRIFNDGFRPVRLIAVSAGDAARSVSLVGTAVPTSSTATYQSSTSAPSASSSPAPSARASGQSSPGASPAPAASESTSPPTRATGDETFSLEIEAGSYLQLVPGQGSYLQLNGLAKPLTPGSSITVTFTFDDGSRAVVPVPVGQPALPGPRVSSAALAR
jgi:hypothetical protein